MHDRLFFRRIDALHQCFLVCFVIVYLTLHTLSVSLEGCAS